MRLISEEYRNFNKELHKKGFGGGGRKHIAEVRNVADKIGAKTILDYGCGKGYFRKEYKGKQEIREYDPAIEGKSAMPSPADIVVCTDVIEHVEPDCLDDVLSHIRSLAKMKAYLVIATRPSNKTLSDGRNAHLIIEAPEWWVQKLTDSGFNIETHSIRYNKEGRALDLSVWCQ